MGTIKTRIKKKDGSGVDILELRNCHETYGHDDTLPFNADVYLNGEPIAHAWNTGWGNTSEYSALETKHIAVLQELAERVSVIDAFRAIPGAKYSLALLFDLMAEAHICCHARTFTIKPL